MIHFNKTNTPINIMIDGSTVGTIKRIGWSTPAYELKSDLINKTFGSLSNAKLFALSYFTGAYHGKIS